MLGLSVCSYLKYQVSITVSNCLNQWLHKEIGFTERGPGFLVGSAGTFGIEWVQNSRKFRKEK